MLASGLVENLSITHLNLAHNKIADRGVRALAKLLDASSVVSMLELQVGAHEGVVGEWRV